MGIVATFVEEKKLNVNVMDKGDFKGLATGDIVRHKIFKQHSFIVTSNYGNRVTAVATVDMTNPHEWEIIRKVKTIKER